MQGGVTLSSNVMRVFVEKKPGYDIEARQLQEDIKTNLGITSVENIRILNCYDVEGLSQEQFRSAVKNIFSEKTVDTVYSESFPLKENEYAFAVEYLPGQYDQRADSAAECIQLIYKKRPLLKTSKVVIIQSRLNSQEIEKIKRYYINPVDTREAQLSKSDSIDQSYSVPGDVDVIKGFILRTDSEIGEMHEDLNLAMSIDDLILCRDYFRDEEKRNPKITEIRVLDTYWSDHCRHTTFLTEVKSVSIEEGNFSEPILKSYNEYLNSRTVVYGSGEKSITLMDIALIAMKELKKQGRIKGLDESDEINACSIKVPVIIDDRTEEWLVMFKNETHNHPTEIEPFGGAATCLGGAIRDPLSGRAYVYQAMRVTGSGDPRARVEETLPGKLPQRKITTGAAHGYSSYGNQIGLSTGMVAEIYDEGYIAKRMEIGAVIGAAPSENVIRKAPSPGDLVVLLGGRTGRDGCGGATGSSKKHTADSLASCGAEVQKGNPPTERKIQRLFRKKEASRLIKRCNDFGAGGVSVAIGELADGLRIDLDKVPRKYEGLDGTEIAISESQERMAVVVEAKDVEEFIRLSEEENLEAAVVAEVTEESRLIMTWRNKVIVDISREFLNTNGAKSYTKVEVKAPGSLDKFFEPASEEYDLKEKWTSTLRNLNVCSQKGLAERFDSTIGSGSVLMPFGGKYQLTPAEAMVCKLPVLKGVTKTASIMSYGFNPNISRLSPFHGAVYAVVEAVSRAVAVGADYSNVKLTFQEYFERLGNDPSRWGKPFAALLGAYYVQKNLGIAAIGGKDSMSGSFNEMDVPPTLVAFAVDVIQNCEKVVSQEFKGNDSKVILIGPKVNTDYIPDFNSLKAVFSIVKVMIDGGKVLSCQSIRGGGICEAVSKMCFGNKIGFKFSESSRDLDLFLPRYGSFLLELKKDIELQELLKDFEYIEIGNTQFEEAVDIKNMTLTLDDLIREWTNPLEKVFPSTINDQSLEYTEKVFDALRVKRCNF
ncbi:MAG: phosphoribosylformylglycinamidine synthase, partial [Bacillota bacterium]|nr:phosphoribosylformylglycinamidine synthase [Bacillota bacterium]